MQRNDFLNDVERVRDDIKDMFIDLSRRYPEVTFSAEVVSVETNSKEGKIQTFEVVITTTHSD